MMQRLRAGPRLPLELLRLCCPRQPLRVKSPGLHDIRLAETAAGRAVRDSPAAYSIHVLLLSVSGTFAASACSPWAGCWMAGSSCCQLRPTTRSRCRGSSLLCTLSCPAASGLRSLRCQPGAAPATCSFERPEQLGRSLTSKRFNFFLFASCRIRDSFCTKGCSVFT